MGSASIQYLCLCLTQVFGYIMLYIIGYYVIIRIYHAYFLVFTFVFILHIISHQYSTVVFEIIVLNRHYVPAAQV